MSDIKTGGPAFPAQTLSGSAYGMTLRDYFAAMALQGLLAGRPNDPEAMKAMTGKLWAISAYAAADAMMAQREPQ